MTIVKTYDVFCDGVDDDGRRCTEWTSGTTASAGNSGSAAREAREIARRRGWARRDRKDLCPKHKAS